MFTGNSCGAEDFVNLLVHHPCSGNYTTVLFCSQILLLFLSHQMTVSSHKVVLVTLPQLDITFQLKGMAVSGFPFNYFFH